MAEETPMRAASPLTQYPEPGSADPPAEWLGQYYEADYINQELVTAANAALARIPLSAGFGVGGTQYQAFMSGLDKFRRSFMIDNCEYSGYTFITRPKLNLTTSSLLMDRTMMLLNTENPRTPMFALRALLDTKWAREHLDLVQQSPYVNALCPFLTPLCNGLIGMQGWPDLNIQMSTSDGGYHSEAQQIPSGWDRYNRTYEFTLEFKDPMGAPLTNLMTMWLTNIGNLAKGIQLPYYEDIEARRLCMSVSIYRFLVDPTHRYITRYAKATGVIPSAIRIGPNFDINEAEHFVKTACRQTVRVSVNKVEYNDYAILQDFNTLVRRYAGRINSTGEYVVLPNIAENNYLGLPYVVTDQYGTRLEWRQLVAPAVADAIRSAAPTAGAQALASLGVFREVEAGLDTGVFKMPVKAAPTGSVPGVDVGDDKQIYIKGTRRS